MSTRAFVYLKWNNKSEKLYMDSIQQIRELTVDDILNKAREVFEIEEKNLSLILKGELEPEDHDRMRTAYETPKESGSSWDSLVGSISSFFNPKPEPKDTHRSRPKKILPSGAKLGEFGVRRGSTFIIAINGAANHHRHAQHKAKTAHGPKPTSPISNNESILSSLKPGKLRIDIILNRVKKEVLPKISALDKGSLDIVADAVEDEDPAKLAKEFMYNYRLSCELLEKANLELDSVDTNNDEEIRAERKAAIRYIQEQLKRADAIKKRTAEKLDLTGI